MKKRIWLISGISSGLGKALAAAVIAADEFVIGTFRNPDQLNSFNEKYGDKALGVKLDITDDAASQALVDRIEQEFGRVDILVNNAGTGFAGAVEESSEEEIRRVMEINFFGSLQLTQKFLPLMRRQKSGHIIQISSHGGVKAFAGFGIYNASKFALEGISEALAQEIAPLGIKLTLVEPGPFRTGFAGEALNLAKCEISAYAETAGAFRKKLKSVHGKQEGDPDKAAQAIIELVNAENPPLRMPLGKTAMLTMGMKVEQLQADLEKGREVAEGAVF